MVKWLRLSLLLVLLAGMTTACGGGSGGNSSDSTTDSSSSDDSSGSDDSSDDSDDSDDSSDDSDDSSDDSDDSDDSSSNDTYTYSDCSSIADQTELMVCLSHNMLSTLTDDELDDVIYQLDETYATQYWSNLPASMATRIGIQFSDMSSETYAAAEALLNAALSAQGQETMSELRAADEYLGNYSGGYGEDYYYVSFLGEPSTSDAWLLEFTGHHYTFFAAYNGEPTSLTPNFVAVEPVSWEEDGETHQPMERHRAAFQAMFDALGSSELAEAEMSRSYGDVLVGPQEDGDFPSTPEGLSVAGLTDAQRDLVIAVIDAYAGDAAESSQLDAYTTDEALDETYIAWSGDVELQSNGNYARVDGPGVWIEFSVQNGVIFNDPHYHTIWRDKELDYGGNFDF